jgi:indole-3-glycerol phosphate synthase
MASLIEVHNEEELERAMACEVELLGINNRDLKSLTVSLSVFEEMASRVPTGPLLVAESGIHTRADVEVMAHAGADAILVGESVIVQQDRAGAVRQLCGVKKAHRD